MQKVISHCVGSILSMLSVMLLGSAVGCASPELGGRGEVDQLLEHREDLRGLRDLVEVGAWANGSSVDWANQSHDVSRDVVYVDVPAEGGPPKLDQGYVDRAGSVMDQQLERAGVRLAMVLNRAMK